MNTLACIFNLRHVLLVDCFVDDKTVLVTKTGKNVVEEMWLHRTIFKLEYVVPHGWNTSYKYA